MEQCLLLGLYELPGGNCAQWFSGSASALAVAVAVGAHFFTAWRQSKIDERKDAAEIAGISMLLRGILKDTQANFILFSTSCRTIKLWDEEYIISKNFGAVRALQFDLLNKDQAEVLLRNDATELAGNIFVLIGRANFANLGIEDYARLRADFTPLVEKYLVRGAEKILDKKSDEADVLLQRLYRLSHSAKHFISETRVLVNETIKIAQEFNLFCSEHAQFHKYIVDTSSYEIKAEESNVT